MPTSPHTPAPNVLQVIPELDTGGAEQTTVDVAKGILEAGGKAIVATRGGRLGAEITAQGGQILTLPVHSKNPVTIFLNIFRLRRIIKDNQINIVHARSRAPAWSALAAARATGTRFVTTYHGTYNAKSVLKRIYNSAMARGDEVIANSHFIADRVRAEHPGLAPNLTVIPRGTDLAVHDPKAVTLDRLKDLKTSWAIEENTAPIILLVGRLTAWKGQTILIDAAERLVERGVGDFLVVFAGDPQGRDDYVKLLWSKIEEVGLKTKFRLVGHCSDTPAAYILADIVVSASTDPEAFGRIAVEAQAMERIIIASDHGGTVETVVSKGPDRTGWRVKPSDDEDLANALEEALALSGEERSLIGVKGRKNSRNFSVEAMVKSTLAVYEKILKT
jgi:glycosyltransferase involved in cell wall biosynthesis